MAEPEQPSSNPAPAPRNHPRDPLHGVRGRVQSSDFRVQKETAPRSHPRDPLHGVTLETIVKTMVAKHGWEEMGRYIPVRCFLFDPSVKSSLTFLRKTPWARQKLEQWYAGEILFPPQEEK